MKQNTRMYPNLIFLFVCCTNQCEWLSLWKLLLCDLKLFLRCTVYVCIKTFKFSCLQREKNSLLWWIQWLHYCSQKAHFIDVLFFFVCHENPTNCSLFFKIIGWRWGEKINSNVIVLFQFLVVLEILIRYLWIFIRIRSLDYLFYIFLTPKKHQDEQQYMWPYLIEIVMQLK